MSLSMSTSTSAPSAVPGIIDAVGVPPGHGPTKTKKGLKSGSGATSTTVTPSPGGGIGLIGAPDKTNLLILSSPNPSGQPMDLAPRGPSVVQLRPVRPVFGTLTSTPSKGGVPGGSIITTNVNNNGGGGTLVGGGVTPIISVNRGSAPTNLTLLPARATPQGLNVTGLPGNTQGIPTYQITRVGNVRPVVGVGPGGQPQQQPASITVTPLSNPNIRLAAGTTVNNGTWLQTSGIQGFSSPTIRTATITVGGRPVRPVDAKMIHIPQQHVTQLQMVDSKGSILKPQLATPIVNIRGTLPGGATSGSAVTLPLSPFTIRTTNFANISPIQPRPPNSTFVNATSTNTIHKVITQPGHGAPIQFVNANKNVIQAITPIPKLNTVCLTLSTNATLASNNSSPAVAVASRAGAPQTSLIMTPSSLHGLANATVVNTTMSSTNLPITKVYPVGRDGGPVSINVQDPNNMFPSSGSGPTVSVSTVNLSTVSPVTSNSSNASNSSIVLATTSGPPQHLLVHTSTPTINVHAHQSPSGLPPPNLAPGSIAPSYYLDKNFQMNIISSQSRPISLEKKLDGSGPKGGGGLPPGNVFIATAGNPPTNTSIHSNTITIPLSQHLNITQLGQPPGNGNTHNHPPSTVITTTSANPNHPSQQNHHPHQHHQILAQIPHSIISSSSSSGHSGHPHPPTITITPSSSSQYQPLPHNQQPPLPLALPIPTHIISQSIGVSSASGGGVGSILTVTTTTISSSATTTPASSSMSSGGGVPNTNTNSSTVISSSTSTTCSSSSTSTSTSSSTTTTAPPAQSPNHNPNSNTKSTHSPRPSILRKRELGGDHGHQGLSPSASRAQRNLSAQLNFSTSNSTNFTCSSNKENSLGLEKPFPTGLITSTTSSTTTISSSNTSLSLGGGGAGSGVSILKKEFQPPTEESSWQSVSSNSSSGSSTISTTSETAELQLQQQQLSIGGGGGSGSVDLNLSTSLPLHSEMSTSAFVGVGLGSALSNSISAGQKSTIGSGAGSGLTSGLSLSLLHNNSNNSSSNRSTTTITHTQNQNQNGVLRSTQPRSRSSSTSKGVNRDLERLKNKDKDLDAVSPRKKPRKQQLTSSDLLEAASPEIYYQGKGKRFRKGDLMDFTEGIPEKEKMCDPILEEPPPPRIVYYVKKRHMSLMLTNSILPKPLTTHFQRYTDVKAKDEKRPTVHELANQKNVLHKVTGWRIKHMTTQMQELVNNETEVVDQCTGLLNRVEKKAGPNCEDRDLNIVMELLKGNIQRCKVIRDQMSDSKALAIKILDHKAHVTEVINKFACKRPKKRALL